MDTRAKKIITVTAATCLALASACTSKTGTELGGRPENDASVVNPAHSYELKSSHEVNGRQGVCVENGSYWVSGSKTLAKYDSNWDLISVNDDPFKGYDIEGLSFDRANGKLLLLYNRGARIVLGMPQGFYDGYDHEISEVFVYDIR